MSVCACCTEKFPAFLAPIGPSSPCIKASHHTRVQAVPFYPPFTTTNDQRAFMPSTHPGTPSQAKKYFLLAIFCFVQFLDAFNFSALFPALPRIQEDLQMDSGETTWIISAFQLTFASFLLLSGRLSDVTNPSRFFSSITLHITHYSSLRRVHLYNSHIRHRLHFDCNWLLE